MIYKSSVGDLDLSKLTRLYPAVVVDMHGEVAEMSLEWTELYSEKVKLKSYVLIFDFTPINAETKERVTLEFKTKDELMAVMQEVSQFFQK